MRRPAIVIVTFKRQDLLAGLLDSILELTVAPWRVVVVDNENSPRTAEMVHAFGERADERWGTTGDDPDAEGGVSRVVYDPMETNTGGSGGFSEGVRRAFELGAEWFWVMDDDVAVEPQGLEVLARWSGVLVSCGRVADALSDDLGNQQYTARFATSEEADEFVAYVQARRRFGHGDQTGDE